jgi:hypothetical protein
MLNIVMVSFACILCHIFDGMLSVVMLSIAMVSVMAQLMISVACTINILMTVNDDHKRCHNLEQNAWSITDESRSIINDSNLAHSIFIVNASLTIVICDR